MIKNERQYRITKAQADKFTNVLAQFAECSAGVKTVDPLIKLQEDAIRSQLADLRAEVEEYEALSLGRRTILQVESFAELPLTLIRARIAAGLSQKDLAERIGVKEQQIQQYEATEYASASFARLREIVDALGIHIREDVFLPGAQVSAKKLFQRLQSVHIDRDLILKRLLPGSLAARLESETAADTSDGTLMKASAIIGRVFNLSPADIFGTTPLRLDTAVAELTRYKTPANADERKVSAYTVYAHFLAMLTLEVTRHLPQKPVPTDYREIREAIISEYGSMTFEHALCYVWSLGIPVLPLTDAGKFHGACWRDNGRNVIVLKQGARYVSRWLYDLLHELRHAAEKPELQEFAAVEMEELSIGKHGSEEEESACRLAEDVIFNGRADELAQLCARKAKGFIPGLSRIVPQVAAQSNVPVDALAYHLAYLLAEEQQDWWGAATNLQDKQNDPVVIARASFWKYADINGLNFVDKGLLLQALADTEE